MSDEIPPDLDSLKATLKETYLTKANLLKSLFALLYGVSWLFAVNYIKMQGNHGLYWCVLIGGILLYRPILWLVTYLTIKYSN